MGLPEIIRSMIIVFKTRGNYNILSAPVWGVLDIDLISAAEYNPKKLACILRYILTRYSLERGQAFGVRDYRGAHDRKDD